MSEITEPKRILCAIDTSDHAALVLAKAEFLAGKCGASLVVLHVINERLFEDLTRLQGRIQLIDGVSGLADRAIRALGDERTEFVQELIKRTGLEQTPHTTVIQRGYPYEEILKAAAEYQVDLIVMGTKGRGSVARRLRFGSQAEKVFRQSQVDVYFVRHGADAGGSQN